MPTVAASTIITNARRLADQEGATGRFPDAEILTYLNTGSAEIWETITNINGFAWGGKVWLTFGDVTQTGSDPTITLSGYPVGDFANLRLKITTGGSQAAAIFKYSLDGGSNYSTTYTASASGVALGTTGITATFATGTYTLNNVYSAATEPIDLNSSQQYYALPSDFYKVSVVMITGSGSTQPAVLTPLERLEAGIFRDSALAAGYVSKYEIRSDLQGGNWIGFHPQPASGDTLRLHYFPNAPSFSGTSATIEVYNFCDEWVAHYAARRMAIKDEDLEVVQILTGAMNDIEKRIRASINQGRSSDVKHIQNVNRRGYARWWTRP